MEMVDVAAQLASYRQTIDNLDAALVYILAERFRCTNEIGLLKAEHGLPSADKSRENHQFTRLRKLAENTMLEQDFLENLMKFIIGEVIQRHNQIASEYLAKQSSAR
jgi:chorismate mutase